MHLQIAFIISVFGLSLLFNPMLYLSHYQLDRGDIAYMKASISEEDRKEHTFLFSVYPGLYLNAGVEVIYPDFNAQVYHVKISEKYNIDHMAAFVRSEKVKYFVTRESGKEYAAETEGCGHGGAKSRLTLPDHKKCGNQNESVHNRRSASALPVCAESPRTAVWPGLEKS